MKALGRRRKESEHVHPVSGDRGDAVLAILTWPEPTVGSFSLTLLAGRRFQRMFPPWPEGDQGRSEAQGITAANPAELDELVRIGTWAESYYVFAHFTDDELADGIMAVHTTIDGGTRDELMAALAWWRGRGEDIKRVWRSGRWDE